MRGVKRRRWGKGSRIGKVPQVANLVTDALFVNGASLLVIIGLDASHVVGTAGEECGDQCIHGRLNR